MPPLSQIREAKKIMDAFGVRNPWNLIQMSTYLAKTVWDPSRIDVGYGVNHLINQALSELKPEDTERFAAANPGVMELYRERYDPDIDTDRLAGLPEGTVGREYAKFIRSNRIDPLGTLLTMGEPKNLMQYLFRRAYKLHDILHVVLGCEATILGEVRIVSFSLGQQKIDAGIVSRAPAMALAVLMLNIALRNPGDMREAVRLSGEWMRYGERAPEHVAIRFEEFLDRPVKEVRALLLQPAES